MATEIKPPIKYDMVWTMYGKRADFFGIAERFHIDPVTARVIRNRDVITDEEIDTYLNGGLQPYAGGDPESEPDTDHFGL